MTPGPRNPPDDDAPDDRWRGGHLGRLLGEAMRRFDARVLQLMADDREVPLGLAHLADDPLYKTNAGRVENRATLIPHLAAAMKTQATAHWDAALSAVNVPAGPINDIGQALADPQSVARGLATMAGNRPAIASPLRLSDSMPDAGTEPPLLGQNTGEVLQDLLGHSEVDVAMLKARGIV